MHKQLAQSLGGRILDEYRTEDGHVVMFDIPGEHLAEYCEKAAMISSHIAAMRGPVLDQASIDAAIAYLDQE